MLLSIVTTVAITLPRFTNDPVLNSTFIIRSIRSIRVQKQESATKSMIYRRFPSIQMRFYSSSSPGLPPPPPLPPPASPPEVVPWSSSVTVFSSVSSSVVHDSCAPRMAAAARLCRLPLGFAAFTARLCRLLPTGRKKA